MKMLSLYVCDYCGKQSTDRDEIKRCEASHLGLTIEEKNLWETLKESVDHLSYVVYKTNNERTRAAYDGMVEKLVLFEEEHNLSKERISALKSHLV